LTISGTADHLVIQRPRQAAFAPTLTARTGTAAGGVSQPSAHSNTHADENVPSSIATDAVGTAANDPDGGARSSAHVGAKARISIAGTSADQQEPAALDVAVQRTQAKEALVGLGWKPAIARTAVAAAATALGSETTLERLILESLRRCPKPRA
jgi:hypothetical protein